MESTTTPKQSQLNRRQSIQKGTMGVAAGIAALQAFRQAHAGVGEGEPLVDEPRLPPNGPHTTAWMVPLPVPTPKESVPELDPPPRKHAIPGEPGRDAHQEWFGHGRKTFYEIHVKEGQHSFHPQLPTQTIWGYDGILPGPCIEAHYNQPVLIRFHNDIHPYATGFGSPEISVHLHNMHSASESDGFPGDYWSSLRYGPGLTGPGNFKDHLYINRYAGFSTDPRGRGDFREALGTLWYHDHRLDFTEQNVYRGMVGTYLLFDWKDSGNEHDTRPGALRLPSGIGKYDIPIVIADFLFDQSGYLYYNPMSQNKGHLGNKTTCNGKIQPYFKVERRKYRFRLLNCSVARHYEFVIMNGSNTESFAYIANDGNLLPAPLTMETIRLSPAERGEFVIDFSKYPHGTRLYMVNRLLMKDGAGPEGLTGSGDSVLRFDVDYDPLEQDVSQVPDRLRPLPALNVHESVRTRRWEFDKDNAVWTVNNRVFDPEKAAAVVKKDTAEIWVFKGNGSWHHPVHVHMEEFRILSKNGVRPPPHERGRKDVVVVGPDETVRVLVRFRDFTGKYLLHCHNLSHEDHAMMARWDIEP